MAANLSREVPHPDTCGQYWPVLPTVYRAHASGGNKEEEEDEEEEEEESLGGRTRRSRLS